jgi:hypothetical protein
VRLTISEQSISTLLQLVSANTKLEVLTFLIEIPSRVVKSRLLKKFKSFSSHLCLETLLSYVLDGLGEVVIVHDRVPLLIRRKKLNKLCYYILVLFFYYGVDCFSQEGISGGLVNQM